MQRLVGSGALGEPKIARPCVSNWPLALIRWEVKVDLIHKKKKTIRKADTPGCCPKVIKPISSLAKEGKMPAVKVMP